MNRSLVAIAAASAISLGVWVVGLYFEWEWQAAVIGGVLVILFVLVARFDLGDTIAASVAYVTITLGLILVQIWAIPIIAGAIGVTFFLAGQCIRPLVAGSPEGPLLYMLNRLLGRNNQQIAIQRPTIQQRIESPSTSITGPRRITVPPETAVQIRGSSTGPRFAGPGPVDLARGESVARIYNLQSVERTYPISDVLTRELLPVTVTLACRYAPNIPVDVRLGTAAGGGISPLGNPFTVLMRLEGWTGDWDTIVRSYIEKNLRIQIGSISLSQAVTPANNQSIRNNTIVAANSDLGTRGLQIEELQIIRTEPNQAVVSISEDQWAAPLRNRMYFNQEVTRGDAWAAALTAISTAYRDAKNRGMTDEAIIREIIRRTIEQASLTSTVNQAFLTELARLLSSNDD